MRASLHAAICRPDARVFLHAVLAQSLLVLANHPIRHRRLVAARRDQAPLSNSMRVTMLRQHHTVALLASIFCFVDTLVSPRRTFSALYQSTAFTPCAVNITTRIKAYRPILISLNGGREPLGDTRPLLR